MPIRMQPRTSIPAVAATLGFALPVPALTQEQTQWCWAACAAMVGRYYQNYSLTQCDVASGLFSPAGCCTAPSSSACNRPCQAIDVARIFDNLGIKSSLGGPVGFGILAQEIANFRPVEVGWLWGTMGHLVLVVRAEVVGGQPWVTLHDPKIGAVGVRFDMLQTAYGQGQWVATWTGIGR